MSFIGRPNPAPRSFSSASYSGQPGQRGLRSSAISVFGGAGGYGSRISTANVRNMSNMLRSSVNISNGQPVISPANEKETMQSLNGRLAGYLSKVRTLEESNRKLEEQIKVALMSRGSTAERDWSAYEHPLAVLKQQLQDMTTENARLMLQIDNARLAADDFKVKFENEQDLRQGVEQDIVGLRKIIDETQLSRMHLESQIESLREELIFLGKNHEEDVDELRAQINNSNVSVEMDNRTGEDLNETINKIRREYERTAQKNREDMEAWYKSKFDSITAEVSKNTETLQSGKSELSDLHRQRQSLEIDLQALHNMNRSLEDTLNDMQGRSAQEMNQYNNIIRQLEEELGQLRAEVERQRLDYQTLLNLKSKLENEIATYHGLLEGEGLDTIAMNDDKVDFSLEQALNAAPPPSAPLKKVLIINQEIVDGEVVSQTEHETSSSNVVNTWVEGDEEEDEDQGVAPPVFDSPTEDKDVREEKGEVGKECDQPTSNEEEDVEEGLTSDNTPFEGDMESNK